MSLPIAYDFKGGNGNDTDFLSRQDARHKPQGITECDIDAHYAGA